MLISLTIPATYPDPLFAVVGYSSFWTKPRDGWSLDIIVCPARRLMRPSEGGKRVLCGLFIGIELRWPWGQRDAFLIHPWWDQKGWRSPLSIEIRSNAGEVARRLLAASASRDPKPLLSQRLLAVAGGAAWLGGLAGWAVIGGQT